MSSSPIKFSYINLEVVSRYRAHSFKRLKIVSICLIWAQTFANLDA